MDPVLAMIARSLAFPLLWGLQSQAWILQMQWCSYSCGRCRAMAECSFGSTKVRQRLMTHNDSAISSRGIIISLFCTPFIKASARYLIACRLKGPWDLPCSWNNKQCFLRLWFTWLLMALGEWTKLECVHFAQGDRKYQGLKQAVFSICIFHKSLFVILRSDFVFSKRAYFLTLFTIICFSSYELVRGSSVICEVVMYGKHAAGY